MTNYFFWLGQHSYNAEVGSYRQDWERERAGRVALERDFNTALSTIRVLREELERQHEAVRRLVKSVFKQGGV